MAANVAERRWQRPALSDYWRRMFTLVLIVSVHSAVAVAQNPAPDSTGTGRRLSVHVPILTSFFRHRHHAGRTTNAAPDSTEVVSFETGYDGNFHSADLTRDETTSIAIIVTPVSRLELQADFDVWASEAAPDKSANRGRGDAHVKIQWTVFKPQPEHIAVAVAYAVKLPTATHGSLGTGSVDHRLMVPVSAAFRGVQFDAFTGIDADGGPDGLTWGGEAAASLTVAVGPKLSVHAGVSAQSIDTDQPAGRYLSAGATWQMSRFIALDLGARAGLSPGAPSLGLTAGVTTAIITR
jgi:hypothetical protein